jgi:hypothetical protein
MLSLFILILYHLRDGMMDDEEFDFISWKNSLNNELYDFWFEIIN